MGCAPPRYLQLSRVLPYKDALPSGCLRGNNAVTRARRVPLRGTERVVPEPPPESPTPGSSPFPGASLPGHPVSRVPPDPIPLEPLLPRNPKRIHTRNPPGSPRHGTPPQKPLPPGPHSDSRNPSDPLEPLAQRRNACDPFPSLELPTREPSLGLPHTFPLPGAPHPRAIPRTPPYLPARSRLPAAQPHPVRSAHSPLHRPPRFSRSAPPPPPRALFITHARRKTASPSANQRSVAQRRHGKVSQ